MAKWDELDPDLLAAIFGRLDLGDLLLSIPFVCKPWKSASLAPSCWRNLNLRSAYGGLRGGLVKTYHLENFSFSGLLRLLLPRSQGSATHLFLPPSTTYRGDDTDFSTDDLQLLATQCPELKLLAFSWMNREQRKQMRKLIGKWKGLEGLGILSCSNYFARKLLAEISSSCKNFQFLFVGHMSMNGELACALVDLFPEIRQLGFYDVTMEKEHLMQILEGCKHLVSFSVKDCIGFDDADEEILQYARSIRRFTCQGCQLYDEQYYDSLGMGDVFDEILMMAMSPN